MSINKRTIVISVVLTLVCASIFSCDKKDKFIGTTWKGTDDPLFGTVFTQLTPENAGKWSEVQHFESQDSFHVLDQMMSIAEERDIVVKEHTLVWYQQVPRWVTPENANEAVHAWFKTMSEHYGDRFDLIDVVNEPLDGVPEYFEGIDCGDGEWAWVFWSFRLAREHFPKTKLLINEYGILNSAEKTARYVDLIKQLKEEKLVDGIGLQAHGLENTPSAVIQENLETIKSLKLPVYISEWDISSSDDDTQLRIMQEQFPIFWDDPMVKGITFWGHEVGRTWRPDAFLVYRDGKYRPAMQWMLEYMAK